MLRNVQHQGMFRVRSYYCYNYTLISNIIIIPLIICLACNCNYIQYESYESVQASTKYINCVRC